jgi:hypothetical protein
MLKPSRILICLFLVGLILPLIFADAPISPELVTITKTFTTLPYDNSLYSFSYAYAMAHDSQTGEQLTLTNWAVGGQWNATSLYYVWRTFPYFDTTPIPIDATIKNATVSIYITSDNSTTDFNVTLQTAFSQAMPHEPVETTDFYYSYYTGNGGSRNTSEITGVGYWNITLNADGLSWIRKNGQGHTKLVMRSSRDIDNIAPTTLEYIIINTYEAGEAYAPKLIVTYECEGYKYIVHGPYLESGAVYNGVVNVTVNYDGQEPYSFGLDGTDAAADIVNITSAYVGTLMIWNITSSYNHSRSYFFNGDGFEEVWLHVPDLSDLVAQYSITITDLAGLTGATVETDRNVLGYNRVVERQSLDLYNAMPFYLIMYQTYTLKIVSDQASFTWNLVANAEYSKYFTVTQDMVPSEDTSLNLTVSATRLNGTAATIYYNDPQLLTTSITTTIQLHNSTGYYPFYTQTDSGNTQNITLNTLDSSSNYKVTITSTRSGYTLSWQFSLSAPAASANRWAGVWNNVTSNPTIRMLLENSFGIFTVICFIALGSWSDTEWFLGAACVIACFLIYTGFLTIPYAGLSAGLMVVVFMYFHRGKQEMREL